ncbi:MAG TPA: type IV pilin N-terminal domain-containing protein [Thermoplasmata archaeon]|nr:type IV pilin N-terminal domain-containing protein [Thermoplasmata archaeon]
MRRFHRRRPAIYRAVSSVISVILLLCVTVILIAVVATFRFNLPTSSPHVWYTASGNESEQAWGDPTDCTNTSIYAACDPLPAVFVSVTSFTPSYISLSQLVLVFICNGTELMNGTLKALEVVPGSGANPGSGSPVLKSCGTWSWGSGQGTTGTYFNRLLYYQQKTPGIPGIQQGDILVVYSHPKLDFADRSGHNPDDDYHGAPLWCFTVQNACTLYLDYISGKQTSLVFSLSLYQLSGV